MNQTPTVSIVTPSFNQAQFLEKTLLSVLEQDYPAIEYLVVDGGSTDGSVEIIRKYADRIAWWVSEKDNGQADGINKGLRRATGEIVAWLNSDDFYQPGAIADAVQALCDNPDAGFVYGDLQVVNPAGETTNVLTYGDWKLPGLMEFKIIGQPAVFMRREVLAQAGYLDEHYHFLLDHHLWLRMATVAEPKYIPRLWAGEHYHPGSKNAAHAAEFGAEAWRIGAWMQSQPGLAELLKSNQRRIKAGAERLNAFYLFDAQDYPAALRAYLRSLGDHPSAALKDWRRILYAALSPLGLEKIRQTYLSRRKHKYNKNEHISP
jgi:glycosyltransferase involved in cell wall biosynthesis